MPSVRYKGFGSFSTAITPLRSVSRRKVQSLPRKTERRDRREVRQCMRTVLRRLVPFSLAMGFGSTAAQECRVSTPHSFTGRMCAASRWIESNRPDALYSDPLSYKLAGEEGRAAPMGDWIMTPRTRFGDE